MGIFDDFKTGISKLRTKVEEFKAEHTVISSAVSEVIDSLPAPFNSFGKMLWNSLDQKDESAEEVLKTLQKMSQHEEIAFMEITTNIKKLMETNPTKDDILQVSKQVRESEKSIIDILGTKIDNLSRDVKAGFEELKQLIVKTGVKSGTIDSNFSVKELQKYKETIKIQEQKVEQLEIQLSTREKEKVEFIELGLLRANFHYYAKEYEMAIARYDAVLDYDKQNITAINNKGVSLADLGRHQEAILCYDEIIKINPEYADAFINKGVSLYDLGRYQEAILCYDEAIRIKPDYEKAFANKGASLDGLGKHQEAILCYDEIIKINPEYADAFYNKGISLNGLGKTSRSNTLL